MKVLLIDNYDSFTFNIVELLKQLAVIDFTVCKNDEIDSYQAEQFDKIIISPGPALPAQSGNIIHIIQSLATTHSILGICLGHQAIATAFGGGLVNEMLPFHGFQTQLNQVEDHYIFNHIPHPIKVGLYHSWTVDETQLPECLQITSYSTENRIMSVKHKTYDIHGVQFHPESFMTDYGKLILQNFLSKS